jgi:hypothetical protein
MRQPTIKTVKLLFARSGNICAFPGCKNPIVEDSGTVTGQICHIIAKSSKGPRYNANLSEKEKNDYNNLILLCTRHHQIVDKNPSEYTSEVLIEIKKIHEEYNGRKEIQEDNVSAKILLNDYRTINIKDNRGNIIIDSPNTIQANILNIKSPKGKINILPPPNSIGTNLLLKQRIQTLFNKIGDEREKRFPGTGYSVLARKFKSDFGIKDNKWTIIWTYPIECATEIVEYLEYKYANTIRGKKEKAWGKRNYIPPRNILFAEESRLLAQLGLTTKSEEVKSMLNDFFGVNSHIELNSNQHWQFVKYLETVVKNKYE